jgi:hypothetical protein
MGERGCVVEPDRSLTVQIRDARTVRAKSDGRPARLDAKP